MGLFANKICGILNKICGIANKIGGITNKIGGITNKILVLFDRSIRIPRAHARIQKVFYLATVATLQHYLRISVLRVATR